ncbi:MAG: tRNA glutamyl-Q(34) synthetase GluQRS [Spongiibacteraceae bacterium]
MPQPTSTTSPSHYIGRFAPSPTGPLHFGSLLAALASFLDARAHNGQWLVRIEDIDPPREVAGASRAILNCLHAHGLEWDGDVLYQSQRLAVYQKICAQLIEQHRAFYCTCSRLDLAANDGVYAGRCRQCFDQPQQPAAIRLRVDAVDIDISDRIQPAFTENIARDVGDFVIYRKDQLPAYQLAVVIDDAAQYVTHIVRGSDLLESTARQIFLQRCLNLLTPQYAHIPVIVNSQQQKLSKQTLARALDPANAIENLLAALECLHQPLPPQTLQQSRSDILDWAVRHWNIALIARQPDIGINELPARCRAFID